MTGLNNLNGWQRLWLLCAVLWAIFVAVFTIQSIPTETESEIRTQWANAKIELIRKHHSSGESLAKLRQRLYGDASDEDIIHPTQNHSRIFDPYTAVPDDESLAVDEMFESQLSRRQNLSIPRIFGFAFLAWLIPVAGLYFLGKMMHWVYIGFRDKKVR